MMSRGHEVGRVAACLRDEHDVCLLVNKLAKLADVSQHSAVWSTQASTTCLWQVHEVLNCAAWLYDGDQATVIVL